MAPVLDHASVPEWARVPAAQPVDRTAASCTILTFGTASLAAGWSSELTALGVGHHVIQLASGDLARERQIVAEELQRAVVGWRLMLGGPLADVLRVRSSALRAGLLGAEIVVGTTEVDHLPVSCAHCGATTLTTTPIAAAPDRLVTCQGCAETLAVQPHLSPMRGSFLGVKHDAEDETEHETVQRLEPPGAPA